MDKQYIGLTDPGAIINALAARLVDVEAQLAYQRGANETLMGDNATLRSEKDRLQKARIESQALKFKVGDRVVIKYCNEEDVIEYVDDSCEPREIGSNGDYLLYRVSGEHDYDHRGGETIWFTASELSLAHEDPSHDPLP